MIESSQIVSVVRGLEKYRKEIIKLLFTVLFITILVYIKSNLIIEFLSLPLNNLPLFFLTPVDGIAVKIKIAFFGGIVLALPVILYRITAILANRLSKKTKRIMYFIVIPFAILFFTGGIVFGYKFILPSTINFLLSTGNEFMQPTISGSNYFSFVTIFLLSIGIIFELPIVLLALSKLGVVSYKILAGKRKLAIMVIVIIAALVTPTPDAFTLAMVSLPMIILYELSVWLIFISEKRNRMRHN